MYKFLIVKSIQELLEYSNILHEAYVDYKERELLDNTELEFMQMLMRCVATPDFGFLVIVKNKNNLPLGMGAVQYISKDRAHVYSGWHNQKDQYVFKPTFEWLSNYLQRKGFKYYTMTTKRSSGAAIRCFEKKYGFKKESLTFRKDL